MDSLLADAGAAVAWVAVSLALMTAGVAAVDLITPGRLRQQVCDHINAAVLVGAKVLAVAIIIAAAVMSAPDSLSEGLTEAAAYGIAGIIVSVLAFLVLDALLPTHLRALVDAEAFDPTVIVAAAVEVGVALVIGAALS